MSNEESDRFLYDVIVQSKRASHPMLSNANLSGRVPPPPPHLRKLEFLSEGLVDL